MLDLRPGTVLVKGLQERIDRNVLKYVRLFRIAGRYRVVHGSQMEIAEYLGARFTEIQIVKCRDKRKRCGTGRQTEIRITDGTNAESVRAIAGKAVRLPQFYIINIEFGCIQVIFHVGGKIILSERVIYADT
jgi:hypothetical protein